MFLDRGDRKHHQQRGKFPHPSGGGTCVDPTSGLNGTQILQGTQDTLKTGLVSLVQTNAPSGGTRTVTNSANASFQKYTGLLASATGQIVSPGGCVVGPIIGASVPSLEGLDAGTISLTGPAGLAVTLGSQFGLKGAFRLLSQPEQPSSGESSHSTDRAGRTWVPSRLR